MAGKFLDDSGLSYFWGKLKTLFNGKVDKVTGKGLSTEDYTTAEKTKLSGIEENANKTTVSSSITQYGTNPVKSSAIYTALAGKVDTVSGKGLSTNDFTNAYKNIVDRLDSPLLTKNVTTYIDGDSNNAALTAGIYFARHPTETAYDKPVSDERCFYIINIYATTTASIMAIQGQQRASSKIYVKTKTENTWGDWIQIAGNVTTSITDSDEYIPTSKAVYTALSNKVTAVSGKGLSTNDYTTTEKNKLAGIDTGANKTTVDSSLSSTSTNPVQNKVINTALNGKVSTVSGKGLSTNDFTDTYKGKVDRLDSPLLSKNIAAYADSISTAGVYFARHATTPAYDQPVSGTRYYYIINVYSSTTASIMALPGQPRAIGEIYTRIKTEGTWGAWYKFTGTAV